MNLEDLKNKTILLFGKPRAFSKEEFFSQMEYHKIGILKEYSDEVSFVVDGRMMTPLEQNLSDELYESKNIETLSIDILEKELAGAMDADTLLMSLKLSHDKERLKSFLQNSCISDALFLKLLKLYSWGGEDFFENDDNRDVSAAFISRFYENIERNHNVQYATTGFIHLVAQAKNVEMLQAIADLEPLAYHPKIMMAIAMSKYCDAKMQKKLHKKRDEKIDEALSFNTHLSLALVDEFITKNELGNNVAKSIELNNELFEKLQEFLVSLAYNATLSQEMQEQLFERKNKELYLALAQNTHLKTDIVEKLLQEGDEVVELTLYKNRAMPQELLEKAYKEGKYYESLAKNENTPVEILYQLQLDSRYERHVKTNGAFGKHIQSENIGWLA